MKRLLLFLTLLSASGWSQLTVFTTTTAIVRDPNDVIYANGTYNISFVSATTGQNFVGLYAVVPAAQSGSLDSFGAMSVQLIDNNQISPSGSQWRFSICSASGVTCFATNLTVTGATQDVSAALKAAAAVLPSTGGSTNPAGSNQQVQFNNSGAFGASAGMTYNSATGTFTATHITGLSNKPYIDMVRDCGAVGDGSTDDGPAIQACFDLYPGRGFFFPQTITHNCSYFSGQTLYPKGSGFQILGQSGSQYLDDVTAGQMGGTEICFPTGVTGIWVDINSGRAAQGGAIRNIALKGAAAFTSLITPTGLRVPQDLPQYVHSILTIQRATNVLTVTTNGVNSSEGLTQSVGSTVLISGVVGDATMNGRCIIATITTSGGSTNNPWGFTCAQNGSDAGPFSNDGLMSPPTTGASADGIRICSNFITLDHVGVLRFERHGINADSWAGDGCALPFSDDVVIHDSMSMENGGDGFFCRGTDCNAGFMSANTWYYNYLYGIEDQSTTGNTWIGNQISNNGSQWATTAIPTTKAISTIARTLTSGVSTVTVVLSVADANLKLGSCVLIAGVTDSSFNSTAGQCYFLTSYTDSKHFQYEQPGAPANASSSGGTERLGTFAETYLASGLDSGGIKLGTQTAVWSTAVLSNYNEGGQTCKYGPTVLVISGATQLACVASDFWKGLWITANGITPHPSTNITAFANDVDNNLSVIFKSGRTIDKNITTNWEDHLNAIGWQTIVTPASSGGTWQLFRGGGGSKLYFSDGITRINSAGASAVEINNGDLTDGTGGLKIYSGGGSPAVVSTIDGTGLGTFNGGVKVASGAQALTSVQGSTGTKVVAATGAFVSGNCTKTDANGNLVDAATTCGGGAGADLVQTFCTGTATSSVTRGMYPWGAAAMTTSTCATGYSSASELPLARAGTIKNLSVKCATGGSAAGSGVFTVMKNNASAGVTCTVGTGTTCSDTSNTNATAANDTVGLQFTTQAAETLANCRASFEIQ